MVVTDRIIFSCFVCTFMVHIWLGQATGYEPWASRLDYYAWKMGPVPVARYEEVETPEPSVSRA